MKIEKYEKYGKDKYRLFLDNGEVIETYDNVILKLDLLLKKELDSELYQKIFIDTTIQEYYNACQKYIGIRLRSEKEIRDYLSRKKVSLEDIEVVVEKLKLNGELNDDRFVECFIKDKLRFTTMGKYRIILELKKHMIAPILLEKYDELMNDAVMREKMIKIMEKKMSTARKVEKGKLRNQLYHHFINLGYPSHLVVEQLNVYFG